MKQTFDTLYARDSKGKIIQWKIEVISGTQVDIKIAYGEYDGGQTIRWERDIQGVNIGKANETTSYTQAINKAESRITKQKRNGYKTLSEVKELEKVKSNLPSKGMNFTNLTNEDEDELHTLLKRLLPKYRVDLSGDIKPMKASQYYRSKKNWTDPTGKVWADRKHYYLINPHVVKERGAVITKFPCYGQPKINGVRSIIKEIENKISIKSKDGLEYNVAHIKDFLTLNNDILTYNDTQLVLDGELYIHGFSLQNIASAVKKANLDSFRVVLMLFDLAIQEFDNATRWNMIKEHIKPKLDAHLDTPIQIVQTVLIRNEAQAQKYTDLCIEFGYEGAIFRQTAAPYNFGSRKVNMTKNKRVMAKEFKIVDIIPQDKDSTKGNFMCTTDGGSIFAVNPFGTDDFKRDVLTNRPDYLGKNLTCTFYEYTDDMIPFHIIHNIVRDYE